ncbi:hypothetical protein [Sporanaerobium hydrogeniformans]|uniref:hypothetical protein n=1 Tax=Sporanaerobium hydrogeniformans TaxID=3072179 RepID=UPI0015D49682|nr:hypothetical protein [Sporanaerobium hydrogeniformans]
MNYNKLQLSFILLLVMAILQLFTALFIVHKLWLICLSVLAILLCLAGLLYVSKHTKS